jgi:hypothetical protein
VPHTPSQVERSARAKGKGASVPGPFETGAIKRPASLLSQRESGGQEGRMEEKLIAYIDRVKERITMLRTGTFESSDDRISCEAVADSLELVVRELTDLLEIR